MTFVVWFYGINALLAIIGAFCSIFIIGSERPPYSAIGCCISWIVAIVNSIAFYIFWSTW